MAQLCVILVQLILMKLLCHTFNMWSRDERTGEININALQVIQEKHQVDLSDDPKARSRLDAAAEQATARGDRQLLGGKRRAAAPGSSVDGQRPV